MPPALDGARCLEEELPITARATDAARKPDREILGSQVTGLQNKITELARELEQVEREKATVEESHRRYSECQRGREELLHDLIRGVGRLEEAELHSRREAEQISKTLVDLRDAMEKVRAVRDVSTTDPNWKTDLTRSLTTLDNARMELNTARLKWTILSNETTVLNGAPQIAQRDSVTPDLATTFAERTLTGLAYTWPFLLLGSLIILTLLIKL